MSKNLKSFLYNELSLSTKDIQRTIEAFSAYLDEFDKEYKYNFKFLVSHIQDFERATKVHNLFKNQCLEIIEEMIKDSSINEEFSKVLLYKDRLKCNINFNNVMTYSIKEVTDNEEAWNIIGTLKQQSWGKIIENKGADINISIEFRYDNVHFLKRFYSVKASENEHIGLVKDFFNESYKLIVENKLGNDIIQRLKSLRTVLPVDCEMSVVVDDLHSLVISSEPLDNYFDYKLLKIERNSAKTPGTFFILLRNKKIKFAKTKLNNIEEIKDELKNIIQGEEAENEQQ